MCQPLLLVVWTGHRFYRWLTGLWLTGGGNPPVGPVGLPPRRAHISVGPKNVKLYNLRRGPRPAGPTASPLPERIPSPADSLSQVGVSPEAVLPSFPCPNCDRAFASKTGLGVHRRAAHPAVVNEEIDVHRVRRQWGDEELRLMAREEAMATRQGVRFINQHLLSVVPGRTLDAIKGVRRGQRYRDLVAAAMVDLNASSASSLSLAEQVSPPPSSPNAVITPPGAVSTPRSPVQAGPVLSGVSPSSVSFLGHLGQDIKGAIMGLIPVVLNVRGWDTDNLSHIAQDCLEGIDVSEGLSSWLGAVFPPHTAGVHLRPQRRHRASRPGKKAQRRLEYARTQRLFQSNMSWAAREILDATGGVNTAIPDVGLMAQHWGPFVGRASKPVQPAPPTRPKPELAHLWHPVSCEEVAATTLPPRSAPGPDGISVRQWRAVPTSVRALLFNIVLATGGFPPALLSSRTVFVPKKSGNPDSPGDYRPISITSVVVRHLHKILANRLRASRLVDLRQRCFDDGCSENTAALAAVIHDSRSRLRELHVASLDAAKAFDSVSHQAIARVLTTLGVPNEFVSYISAVYAKSSTMFEVRGQRSELFSIGRGVRQGDPLSPILFCLVADSILEAVPPDVGYQLGGCRLNALAFVDDILLFASSVWGMQSALSAVEERAGEYGLTFNAHKCSALSLVPSGKAKKMKVISSPLFHLGRGAFLPHITSTAEWRYLGLDFCPSGPKKVKVELATYLERITRAPLKPQQRLKLVRCFLLPRLYHALVLGRATLGKLRALDVLTRAAVRRWIRLPKDTPSGFFHAPVAGGGLGIPALSTTVPGLMRERLLNLERSQSPQIRAIACLPWVFHRLQWATRALTRDGRVLASKHLRDGWWTHRLYNSTDGWELRECHRSPLSTRWVDADSLKIPGRDFVQHVHVRINALPTLIRTSRGVQRHGQATRCRAGCQSTETAAHVIQGCFRTHGGRILRHNAVCHTLASGYRKIGWTVHEEPIFNTAGGRRKPDLVCVREERVGVIDAQVVSGSSSLDDAHERKARYYADNPSLVEAIAARYGVRKENIAFSSCTISWRGIWSSRSADWLLGTGLTAGLLRGITTRVLQGSHTNWSRWNRMTSVGPPVPWDRRGVG